ncbi:hypothetical protein GCM10023075_77540 [Streptosporangium album]
MCRVSWTRIRGTPAFRQCAPRARLKFRGPIGVPGLLNRTAFAEGTRGTRDDFGNPLIALGVTM